jgi:Zn finger protein HypA/HybF involved in hydrogenase expression
MEKMASITFTCPECRETFEFDPVGEYQLVSCPICGIDHQVIKKTSTVTIKSLQCA